LEHLRQTKGGITGFIGGEYGTLFKRDSIIRMSWVGGDLVFRFDVLARGVGTSYPKSIVEVDGDIYFYGQNDFYVMQKGGKPVPLGLGKIRGMILENAWGKRVLKRENISTQREHDLRITGAYDQLSGLIFWAYDNYETGSSWDKKRDIIVYNPHENRWGFISDATIKDLTTFGIGCLTTVPNITRDSPSLLGNLYIIYNHDLATDRMGVYTLTNNQSLPALVRTNTFSSNALGSETPSTSVLSVRPFFDRIGDYRYVSDSNGTIFEPPFSGTVFVSPDPNMVRQVSSATFSSENMNENGFAQLSNILHGEFWKFEFNIPNYYVEESGAKEVDEYEWGMVKSFLGFQIETNDGGMR
jgi:hypothetical protein